VTAPLTKRFPPVVPALLHDALVVVAIVVIASGWLIAVRFIADDGIRHAAIDAHAYWSADLTNLYNRAVVGELDSFLYSPAAAQVLWPLTLLPWVVFYGVWTAILIACLVFLVGPVLGAAFLLLPPVWADVTTGNIHLLLATAIVVGFRFPGAWALVLLTKVTPGVALLWFALRREWRLLGLAVAVTAAIAAISVASVGHLWTDWVATLLDNSSATPRLLGVPLWIRLVAAAIFLGIGALTSTRWMVPAAAMLALPVLWENSLTMLLGGVALLPWSALQRMRRWPWFRIHAR
jgi:hypothetical protein